MNHTFGDKNQKTLLSHTAKLDSKVLTVIWMNETFKIYVIFMYVYCVYINLPFEESQYGVVSSFLAFVVFIYA